MLARRGDVEVGKIDGATRTHYVPCSVRGRIYLIIYKMCGVYILCVSTILSMIMLCFVILFLSMRLGAG